ncbi:hypothetical protein [Sphingomonas aracearum]|uniref:hypothetical protein n=1 Tax=Sphingomonas aracearum TaxID=2283317 RepID=UPI0015F0A495|nr:hypothetical protein [Sphingomonas aracearum]
MIAVALLLAAGAPPLPVAVRRFAARHASCVHWQGEEPYDAARGREIARGLRRECGGLDAERRRLLRLHAADRRAVARLNQLEDVGS